MKTKLMSGSLTEELEALGVPGLTEDNMARIALGPALSEGCGSGKKKGGKGDEPEPEEPEDEPEEEEDEEYDESKHDPFDGPFVTKALFDRILALPFESLDGDQVDLVIEGLKVKKVPKNVDGIAEQAEVVARKLMEMRGKITRRFKAGKMSKVRSTICKKGYRKSDPKDPSSPCVRSAIAAGGASKLHKGAREKKIWGKSGRGTKSQKKSKLWAGRRPGEKQNSDFAVELEHLLSENQERMENVRDEILGRIGNIVDLIVEEFDDESVAQIFIEAIDPIAASHDAGRLDEDVMNVDAFLAEIRPVMTIISKSLDRIERSDLGNA